MPSSSAAPLVATSSSPSWRATTGDITPASFSCRKEKEMRARVCFWSSVSIGSRRISPVRSCSPSRSSRMPARTYRVSAEMRSALAICWRISADGLRSPRSIWLRYGLEMPAMSDRRRNDSRAMLRCSRMNCPSSPQRSGSSFTGVTLAAVSARPVDGTWRLLQQAVDVGLAALVPAHQLLLQGVDALEQRPALTRDMPLQAGQVVDELVDLGVGQLAEVTQAVGVEDLIEAALQLRLEGLVGRSEEGRKAPVAGRMHAVGQDLGEPGHQ